MPAFDSSIATSKAARSSLSRQQITRPPGLLLKQMGMMKRLVLLAAAGLAFAQERPEFEAASIKLSTESGMGMSMRGGPGQLEWKNTSLWYFVQTAFGVHDYAYSGPAWLDSALFDVIARIPANDRVEHYPEMLQTMLAERFKLAVHRETKEMPGLALVLDKKGLRIKPVEPGGTITSTGPNMVRIEKGTMAQFAANLSTALNRPVKDMTGVAGVFDIKIQWTPDMPASSEPSDMSGSVYAAVQELGLRLQVQKVPVEILVVDRAEHVPIEN
jgi:uncharacterized protein (TIGR03435 family)